jgi:type IV pilus assembly protein PilP
MMRHKSKSLAIALIGSVALFLLTGCAGEEFDDLTEYTQRIKARKPVPIEPIPELKPYETFLYVEKELRNPFKPMETTKNIALNGGNVSGEGPDLDREKEDLEGFPLDTLRMVGTLRKGDQLWGVVRAGDGIIHRVSPGQYMGKNFGKISKIDEVSISLDEFVVTGEGSWLKRPAGLGLSE